MGDVRDGVSRTAQRSEHNRHDRLLIARFAANDASASELGQARELVTDCPDCARLLADVRLISVAVADLPAPARRRDFRLTPEQAAAVRGSWLDRFLRRFAAGGIPTLRPLAGVALSIGLALAVVGTGLPLPNAGMPAAAPLPAAGPPADRSGGQSPAEVAPSFSSVGAGEPLATDDGTGTTTGVDDPESPPAETEDLSALEGAQEPPSDLVRLLLVYAGVTLAAISFGVLLLAWYARRREDPLLP